MKNPLAWIARCAPVVAGLLAAAGCVHHPKTTALDRYVSQPDPHYAYQRLSASDGRGCRTFVLEMTSQSWLTPAEVDRPVWKHWLVVVVPETVEHTTALLFIGGGSNDKPAPTSADPRLAQLALATRSVVAELRMVPNQPLVFHQDGKPRYEDDLIAYTWDQYLRTGDERWPARLPMTKSAVRALDTLAAFCATPEAGGRTVDSFVVAGGSKRGWTTWTTAAVDRRIVAIVPIVIDLLNLEPSFRHHWETYGFYAPAVHDYVQQGIMDWQGTPEFRRLMQIEEPYEYRDRLTLPKFIINATGDQFFVPDSSQFYFDDLPGVKYLRYVPNTDHSLKNSDAFETLAACYHAVLHRSALPQFSWSAGPEGSLRVTPVTPPSAVKLWQATNPKARDFRLDTIGPAWASTDLAPQNGIYSAQIAPPPQGYTAFMIELTFPLPGAPAPFKFTTPVSVVPDRAPFTYSPPARPGPRAK
ncbi:MAG TPA: PhoPQ-activated pathogenicity-related family protein [Candidatus Paceibacterota bacterium]|nr:PhoPQ-activated pathogenicity-related family protein [Verrucomicrobiota bacterium]HRZ44744.1 PhoPQ-activated pathogenicity-related family protein [Candidatus Paceibacterota bacterium]